MSERYKCSEQLLERALKTIPLASQTFSKSLTQYPAGVSPFFLEKGKGCRVWDVDGNCYRDFVSALCSVVLGYGDEDVDRAVMAQLENGVSFTLPHRLEMEVAERLVSLIPCAEKVRFGKNGTDATSGAIRVARAYTGRDRIAVCGYHGWQDWYIGTTSRDLGVPAAVKSLSHSFAYNDPGSLQSLLDRYPGEFAAVIMEPMNVAFPQDGFLERVRTMAHAHGALLVFDETITGFRLGKGGAQELFGVTPDLATFGKGMANGFPLSALVGRADVMKTVEDIFFSGTFGGETLSLAAAAATMDKMCRLPVLETIEERGRQLADGISALIGKHDCSAFLSQAGHPAWSFLVMTPPEGSIPLWNMKTLYLQEIFSRGLLSLGSHNLSYAHKEEDIQFLLSVYDEVFPLLRQAVLSGTTENLLKCEPLVPLFKVR